MGSLRILAPSLLSAVLLTGCVGVTPGTSSPEIGQDPGRLDRDHPLADTASDARRLERGTRLDLMDLLKLAEARNPKLQAAMAAAGAAEGATRQERLWPNPRLQYMESDLGMDPWSWDSGRSSLSITQPLVPSGRLGLAGAAGRAREAVLQLEIHETRHRIYGEVHESWVRVIYFGEALDLAFELQMLAGETEGFVRSLQGNLGLTDGEVARAALEERRIAQDILTTVTARTNEVERLMALLGGLQLSPGNVTGDLVTILPAEEAAVVHQEAIEAHPEWRVARMNIEAARRDLELARRSAWPDPEVTVGVANSRETGENMVEAGVMIPLPIFDRNQGRIAEARELVRQAEELADDVEHRLSARLGTLLQLLSEVDTLATVYNDDLVPQAREAFDLTRQEFEKGDVRLMDLLDAQRVYVETRQLALEYKYDLNRYLAEFRHFNLYPAALSGEH